MTTPLQAHRASRIEPGLIEAATRQAHALHRQAIDDALRQVVQWLRRCFDTPTKTVLKGQPCHS